MPTGWNYCPQPNKKRNEMQIFLNKKLGKRK
jgi:hypothetical protein